MFSGCFLFKIANYSFSSKLYFQEKELQTYQLFLNSCKAPFNFMTWQSVMNFLGFNVIRIGICKSFQVISQKLQIISKILLNY